MLARKNKNLSNKLNNLGFSGFSKPYIIAHILPYLVFIILYIVQDLSLPRAGVTHASYLKLIGLKSILKNCIYYFNVFKFFFSYNYKPSTLLHSWLVVFFFYGFIRYALKYPLYSIYLLGVMGILILWPSIDGERFCFPTIPFIIIFTAFAIRDFIQFLPDKRFYKAGIFIEILVILLCLSEYTNRGKYLSDEYGAYTKDAKQLYSFVMENTKKDEKIVFFEPRVLYLETGRLGFTFQPENIKRLAEADYLILCREGYRTFDYDIESQYPEESRNLAKIFENDSFKMYTINNGI